MRYTVVAVTSNLREYPECEQDNKKYPYLIQHIDDEWELFIVADDGDFWVAEEFFAADEGGGGDIRTFTDTTEETK